MEIRPTRLQSQARLLISGHRFWPYSGATTPVPALDGLRAMAVLLTLVFHAWFVIPGIHDDTTAYDFPINYGRTGVQLFYVLSGFLLFQPYARWILEKAPRPSTRRFYLRRLRRVAPAYWACLAVLVLVQPQTSTLASNALLHLLWLQNLSPTTAFSINTVFWTMAVEVQFYAILPLCAIALRIFTRRIGLWPATTLLFSALLLISVADATLVNLSPDTANIPVLGSFVFATTGLPYWLAVFACGMYLRMLIEVKGLLGGTPVGYCAFAGALVLAFSVTILPPLHHVPIRDLLFGPAYAGLVYAVLSLPSLTQLFSWAPVRFIGLISYSLYLWHYVVIKLIEQPLSQVHDVSARVALGVMLGITLSVPFSYAWYLMVERPFLIRKPPREHPETVISSPMVASSSLPRTPPHS